MNTNDFLKAIGHVSIAKTDINGVTEIIEIPNRVVSVGKNFIASRIGGGSAMWNAMSHMAIGSTATAATDGDVKLTGELGRAALKEDATTGAKAVVTANSIRFEATFAPGTGTGDVKEAGIFNNQTSGSGDGTAAAAMLCRTTFPIVTKQDSDSITITWTVTIN